MKTTVYYHKNCMDGFVAALCFRMMQGKEDVTYIPIQYGTEPDVADYKDAFVYVLDFSFSPETLERMINDAFLIFVLDHHKTAIEKLENFYHQRIFLTLDTTRSGAKLTFDYFKERGGHLSSRLSDLVEYVQDRDLWKWELPESREVSAALASYEMDFDLFTAKLQETLDWVETLREEGRALLRAQNKVVESTSRQPLYKLQIETLGEVVTINTSYLISEVGNALATKHGAACMFFFTGDKIVFSLRSVGDIDVASAAQRYGGGGHKNAAGFSLPLHEGLKMFSEWLEVAQ